MDKVEITVIGAGIVGLALAAELSEKTNNLYVLEKNKYPGMESSSRNSEVIHSGIHYPEESLKKRLCIRGKELIYEICDRFRIPYKNTGKLIVATKQNEIAELEALLRNGERNGLKNLKILTEKETRKYEPHIKCKASLFVPSTGILDSHQLMRHYISVIKKNSADIIYNSEVVGISRINNSYEIRVRESQGEEFRFFSDIVINSAGLESDTVARMAGLDLKMNDYELHYCKGDYFRISNSKKASMAGRPVYPLPGNSGGLGIHLTPDLGGSLRLGPDSEYIERKMEYIINENKVNSFYESVKIFFPALELTDLSSDTSGIRPKLHGKEKTFRDFVIKEESDNGLPGFINLIGIESPGLTSAPAIAEYVNKMINM